jgi:glutathione S-transferase
MVVLPLAAHSSPRYRSRLQSRCGELSGRPSDEAAIARGEKAPPDVIKIVEGNLATNRWMLGADFSLVDCAYSSVLNVREKAQFSFADFPKVKAYLDALRARPAWKETPKLPML